VADHFFDRAQEKLKTCYIPERLPAYSRSLFYALNSRPFLFFLAEMTDIKGLIPDPYFRSKGLSPIPIFRAVAFIRSETAVTWISMPISTTTASSILSVG